MWVWQELKDRLGLEEMFTGYGMTELTSATTFTTPDDPLERVATTVGRPLDAGAAGIDRLDGIVAEYKTIDPLSGADLPPGAEGELCARSRAAHRIRCLKSCSTSVRMWVELPTVSISRFRTSVTPFPWTKSR